MSILIVLPILIPMTAGVVCIILRRSPGLQQGLAIVAGILLCAAAAGLHAAILGHGPLASQMGGWPAPFGITLVADRLASLMVLSAAIVGLAAIIYSTETIENSVHVLGPYPLMLFLLAAACGSFLTGDLFNLYVWIELLLVASFVLLAVRGERLRPDGAIRYVVLSMIASFLLLASVGLLYGLTGTLNLADLARLVASGRSIDFLAPVAVLFLVALGIKAAVFPWFFWLPGAYSQVPTGVAALFAGVLTKVGVYAILRMTTLVFFPAFPWFGTLLVVLGGLTLLAGALMAVAEQDWRRVLCFLLIADIGYILMGVGLADADALAAAVFFTLHVMITTTALFLITGLVGRYGGSYDLEALGGLYNRRPLLALLFLIAALSVVGIPPLSGFVAKLALVSAGLESGAYITVGTVLVGTVVLLHAVVRLWTDAFWKPAAHELPTAVEASPTAVLPIALLASLIVLMGVLGGPLVELAREAGRELGEPARYIRAVLRDPSR